MFDFDLQQTLFMLLEQSRANPSIVLLLLFFVTFILEDLATTFGAVLSAAEVIDPFATIGVLFTGILLGDVGLYGLGLFIRSSRFGPRLAAARGLRFTEGVLQERWAYSIFVSRFIPGARLPTFTAAGFFSYPLRKFILLLVFAVGLWTGVTFVVIYTLGDYAMAFKPVYAVGLVIALVALGTAWPTMAKGIRAAARRRSSAAGESSSDADSKR